MRSFETSEASQKTRSTSRRSPGLSPDICEFLDMLSAIETRQSPAPTPRG